MDDDDDEDTGFIRWWEGGLNVRKILERIIAAIVAGTTMAVVFYGLGEVFG